MREIIKQLRTVPQKVMLTSGSSQMVRPTMAAFKMRTKMPMVTKMSGNAKMVAMGLTMALTREKMRPAEMYSHGVSAPGVTEPNHLMHTHIAVLEMSQRNKNNRICFLTIMLIILAHFSVLVKYGTGWQSGGFRHLSGR